MRELGFRFSLMAPDGSAQQGFGLWCWKRVGGDNKDHLSSKASYSRSAAQRLKFPTLKAGRLSTNTFSVNYRGGPNQHLTNSRSSHNLAKNCFQRTNNTTQCAMEQVALVRNNAIYNTASNTQGQKLQKIDNYTTTESTYLQQFKHNWNYDTAASTRNL